MDALDMIDWLLRSKRLRRGVSNETLVKHSGVLGAAATGFNCRRVIGVDGAVLLAGSDLKLLDFCMIRVAFRGGVGQTERVLFALTNG